MLRVRWCPYGAPAVDALGEEIDRIKGDDPLRPATVVVDRGPVGLALRRSLAARSPKSGRCGVANVAFTTLGSLADGLAAPGLVAQGRLPLTDTVRRAAVRAVLLSSPGWLGAAGDHPSTVEAVVATCRELRSVEASGLDALEAGSERGRSMVELFRAVRRSTRAWYDEVDVLDAAAEAVAGAGDDVISRLGSPIFYLPRTLEPAALHLVRAMTSRWSTTMLLGVTGEGDVDAASRLMVEGLGPHQEQRLGAGPAPRVADVVVSAATADAELLVVLRDVMTRAAAGTPLETMAIVHAGGSTPYVTMLHTLLRQAGIPFNGSPQRPLAATVCGRLLLGALSLPEHGWRRDEMVQWLNTGPLMFRAKPVPATRWDVLSAEAGVSEGLEEWRRCLGALSTARRVEAGRGHPDLEDDEMWRRVRLAEADQCDALMACIDQTAAHLSSAPTTWPAWTSWARRLLHSLVGGVTAIDQWPAEERAAAEEVEAALGRLAVLGDLDIDCSPRVAAAALATELAAAAPQTTRFGTGIWVAPLHAVAGLCLDVLYVVGMHEGVFPTPASDDVLLPDRERKDGRGRCIVPLRAARVMAQRRDYLAALAGTSTVHLSYPRGNPRDGRQLRPSRWALDAIGARAGRTSRLYLNQLDDVPLGNGYRVEPSYTSAVSAPGEPMDLHDRDLKSLLAWTDAGRPLEAHPLCTPESALGRGVAMVSGRRRGFTRYEGLVGAAAAGLVPTVWTASGLERYAQCPRRFFFESVLRVVPRPVTERLTASEGGALGLLQHRILEEFLQPAIGLVPTGAADDPFAPSRLLSIAEREMAAFEQAGLAGPPTMWRVERTRLLRTLRRFAETDRAWRDRHGIVTVAVEQSFGQEGMDPVEVPLPSGQVVRFRGRVDRVDVEPGGRPIVTDYKTGRSERFKDIGEDHFRRGRSVQLPLYAAAVGASADRPVAAAYWCVGERAGAQRHGFTVDGPTLDQLGQVVGTLTDGVSSGRFPANPGDGEHPDPCTFCPYTAVCPVGRVGTWQQVRRDRALSGYVELVG
jgi:ATP-dependent helicase/nuclease subunit B